MSSPSSRAEPGGSSAVADPGTPQHHEVVLELRNAGLCYRRGRGVFRRHRREFWALEDVSLQIRAGETLGIIGRNGAGKTTLLQILAGILRPDRGELIEHGYQATLLSLQVGFVPYLSGRKNVVLSGLLLGLTLREIEEKMDSIIEFAELEGFVDEPIQTYSSGMRARLGFSTAFHVDPEILLIDEVLGVGDAAFVEKSKAVMREKIRSEKTVVLVSHSVGSIRSLCDRAIWIDQRRLRMEGDPDDVMDAYLDDTKGKKQRRKRRVERARKTLDLESTQEEEEDEDDE